LIASDGHFKNRQLIVIGTSVYHTKELIIEEQWSALRKLANI
jgi:hypothetical protein